MATFEVHDGQGHVERVRIAHDQPIMFGASPKCEIVLNGAGILPFHGRLRWSDKRKKFKVDASPEAEYVHVNGHKMASASLRQGDEIVVGNCRIFLISEDDPNTYEPPPRDDKTRVQPSPFVGASTVSTGAPAPRSAKRVANREMVEARQSALFEFDDEDAPLAEEPEFTPVAPPDNAPARGWKAFFQAFSRKANRPGEENLMNSPLVFGLLGTLAVLVLVGFALYGIIVRTTATRLYNRAMENLEDGDYLNAIRRFDEFLERNPKDARSPGAEVHRAMANVRQYTNAASASWSVALEAEAEMVEKVGEFREFRDSSTELAELVLRTGEALADRARVVADEKSLAEAESTVALHQRILGDNAEVLYKQSRLPEKLVTARAAIRKSKARIKALADMDAALKEGSSGGVYAARDVLVTEYVDQAEDRELLKRMNQANELIRKAVKIDPSERPAETEPHRDPLGPPLSLVIRSPESVKLPPQPANAPLVFGLADGMAYALESTTGRPLWQVPVGLSAPFAPQPIPGGTTVLVVDARHDELIRLNARTGELAWRQSLGEPVTDPPLVLGNQVVQGTPEGKLLMIDLATGALRGSMDLGMQLTRTPVVDESGQALYLVAESDCLFVISRDPLGCASVVYTGHAPGSIAAPPARVGRYLILGENHQIDTGRLRVFVISEDGTELSPVQQIPVQGWTWGTPASSGSVLWSAGDRGGATAYAIGAYGQSNPFRVIARANVEAEPSGPAYAIAKSEREMWVGSARSGRFELDPEKGRIASGWTLIEAGPALAPPQLAGPLIVLTQQNQDGPGASLWGLDAQSGAVRWRTILGARWPVAPVASADGRELHALGADGRSLTISRDSLAHGGFVTSTLTRPGYFRLPTNPVARIEGNGWIALFPALGSPRMLVRAGGDDFKEVNLPAGVGARPLLWGNDLFIPGSDGRAYLLDPVTGESRAEPFVPAFDRSRKVDWRTPVMLDENQVVLAETSGKIRRIVQVVDPRPRLIVAGEVDLGKPLAADPATVKGAIIVVTTDQRVRALSARDLAAIGAWPLEASLAQPPTTSNGRCFLADGKGGLLVIGDDGVRLWSTNLQGTGGAVLLAGPPAIRDQSVWFFTRDGTLHGRALADGARLADSPLRVLPADGPVSVNDALIVPVGLGTLRVLNDDAATSGGNAKP